MSRKGPGKASVKVMPLAANRSASPSVRKSRISPHQENRRPSLLASPDGSNSACRAATESQSHQDLVLTWMAFGSAVFMAQLDELMAELQA